eukprot:Sdes_comp10566_c0_seq1m2257
MAPVKRKLPKHGENGKVSRRFSGSHSICKEKLQEQAKTCRSIGTQCLAERNTKKKPTENYKQPDSPTQPTLLRDFLNSLSAEASENFPRFHFNSDFQNLKSLVDPSNIQQFPSLPKFQIAPSKPSNENLNPHKEKDHSLSFYNNDNCEACGDTGELLCCDSCPASFHFYCADPPEDPSLITSGQWL